MRLGINYRKKSVKNTNTWRLNNTVLNNQEIIEEIKEEIKKYLETNDNENTTTQNLWDAAKAVLRPKFIPLQSYRKTQETSQINNLNLHLKQLEKEERFRGLSETEENKAHTGRIQGKKIRREKSKNDSNTKTNSEARKSEASLGRYSVEETPQKEPSVTTI